MAFPHRDSRKWVCPQLLLEHLTGITQMEREHLVPCPVCLCWSCHSPGGIPEFSSCLRGALGMMFVGFQSATSLPFWVIKQNISCWKGLSRVREVLTDVVNSKVPMMLGFLPEISPRFSCFSSFGAKLWGRGRAGISLKITFSMCTSAFYPRSWDLCIRLLTTKLIILAENQSIFVQEALAFPMGTVVFQHLLLPSPFRTNFCGNLQLPGCAPSFPRPC